MHSHVAAPVVLLGLGGSKQLKYRLYVKKACLTVPVRARRGSVLPLESIFLSCG